MARVVSVVNSFLNGEFSPNAYGRTDIAKYQSGLSCLRNFLHDPLGGVKRRAGLRFVCEAKYPSVTARLIPFEPNTTAAYMLEAGCQYIRFYKDNAALESGANLIGNGSFDADLSGWTTFGDVMWDGGAASLSIGTELVTNGEFTSSLAGWIATGAWSGGTAVLNGGSSVRQSCTVVQNEVYALQFQIVSGSINVRVGTTGAGTDIHQQTYTTGEWTLTLSSSTTTMSIFFVGDTNGVLDNVHLRAHSYLRQNATVVADVDYTLTFQLTTPQNLAVRVGSTTCGTDLVNDGLATGTHTYELSSPTTTMSLMFVVDNPEISGAEIDNVTLRRIGRLELTTPYGYGEVAGLDTVQSADEQYWLHECHATRKLQRYGDTCWRFNCVVWSPPPTIEYGARVQSDISVGAVSGQNVTVTAFNNSPAFLAADVDREIQVVSGANAGARGGIKSVSSAMVAVINVCVPWLDTTVQCAGTWKIAGSPMTTVTPDTDTEPVGKSSALTLSVAGWRNGNAGETDVGKLVLINGGAYEITCVSSTTSARGIVRSVQTGTTAVTVKGEAGAWSLEEPIWNCHRGFASTGDFHNDRLYLNSTFRLLGSKTGDYENFAAGVNDDDGVNFAINSKTITTIRGIVGGKDLQIFTVGGEYSATSEGAVITPTDILVSAETTHGATGLAPIRIGGRTTLFVDRSGKQVLEFTVPRDSISDQYEAPNLLLLAEHLTANRTIVDWAFQRRPSPILWCVMSDGELLSMAYRREENVVAWAKHNTQGTFEAIGVMPHPDGDRDQVWLLVRRTINGSVKRYVEYMDDATLGPYDRRYTDASVTYSCTGALTRLTGLAHLECATVAVLANGQFLCTQSVTGAQVKVTDDGSITGPYEVGLPYTSELVTLQPEVQFGGQSIQPMAKRWARVFVRYRDSCGMTVRTGTAAFESVPTGQTIGNGVYDASIPRTGDFVDGRITIRQESPLPAHILMTGGTLVVDPE